VPLGLHGPTSQLLQATNGLECYSGARVSALTAGSNLDDWN
jgi:hypothetical protein